MWPFSQSRGPSVGESGESGESVSADPYAREKPCGPSKYLSPPDMERGETDSSDSPPECDASVDSGDDESTTGDVHRSESQNPKERVKL